MVTRLLRIGAVLVAFFTVINTTSAQILTPVKWTFSTEQLDGKTFVVFKAKIDDTWSVYSQYLASEDGPVATSINYDTPEAVKFVGKAVESGGKKSGFDDIFNMDVVKFQHDYIIRQEVEFKGKEPLVGYLTFMTCDNTRCLPPTDVDFSLPPPSPQRAQVVKEQNLKAAETVAPAIVEAVEQAKAAVEKEEESAVTPGLLVPITWSVATQKVDDSTYLLRWTADIQKGWTVYSQEVDEGGPVPTSFSIDQLPGFRLLGSVSESGKRKSGLDPVFEVNVTKFLAPTATFEQKVVVQDANAPILGFFEFMTCDDSRCLPPEEKFYHFIPEKNIAELVSLAEYEFLLETAKGGNPVAAPVAALDGDLNGIYAFDQTNQAVTCGESMQDVKVEADASYLTIFLLGFGGGLLALLTPCVFPMIPLTVSFFTGRGTDRKKGLQRALIYGASIIGIYVTLGLLITGLFGADALNLLSTNAWFNLIFGILFLVFAFSFFGFFEITLPSSWSNKADRAADQGGLLGIFFMAFTLSLVSFSCTGPIIGTLLVETATGGGATILGRIPVAPLIGMLGFSSALALPFTLFAAFPSALESLPKSGGWMNTVKVTLGFVEIALAIKFLSTSDLIMGTKWMPYELFVAVWVLCALGLASYYFGWLKTPLEKYGAQKVSNVMLGLGALTLVFAVYVALGFQYDDRAKTFDTPSLLSGLAPPAGHSYIYPNHCPQNLDCFKDFDLAMEEAKKVGKPVLVDFTGHGCVNCRKMEDNVWDKPGVYNHISEDFVLVSLYVDEREALEKPFVSEYSGSQVRTVGNKWADFQARYFDINAQPYYVLMSPDGHVLNQPVGYTPDVEEYASFLECGLQQFEKLKGKSKLLGEM